MRIKKCYDCFSFNSLVSMHFKIENFLMNKFKYVPSFAYKIARVAGYAAYIGCVVHCVFEYIGDFVICVGPSMEPTIFSESVVVTDRISVHKQKINRNDIVICKSPFNPEYYICKRVKALSGDVIRYGFTSETVPKGHIWLEGDNKSNSSDSRFYGPVPQGLIRGRVVFVVWPFSNFRKFNSYADST